MVCGDRQGDSAKEPAPASTNLDSVDVKKQTLKRLVSESALSECENNSAQHVSGCEDEAGKPIGLNAQGGTRSGSPMRCVSEFDEVTATAKNGQDAGVPSSNPLCCVRLRSAHVRALRLEADLQPMRMILGRLMLHPLNKKGIFNSPVDALALGLPDYDQIIKKPMDLGTIKTKLHSITYHTKEEVAEDICLVFHNAMLYNPPRNAVHIAARSLQDFFEELFLAIGGDKESISLSVATPGAPTSSSRRVSFTQQAQVQEFAVNPTSKGVAVIARSVSCDGEAVADDLFSLTSAETQEPTTVVLPADIVQSGSAGGVILTSSPLSAPKGRCTFASSTPPMEIKHQRKRRLSYSGHNKRALGHTCRSCLGRTCLLCEQKCLPLEPTLLVCNGANCAGAKIRKGSTYYIASDGSRQFCQRCFTSLPPVLSSNAEDETTRYKRDLLKRKNDEELVEAWVTCSKCQMGVHQMCALHYSFVRACDDYTCPGCTMSSSPPIGMTAECTTDRQKQDSMYTFITGSETPVPFSEVNDESSRLDHHLLSAQALPETAISAFIETKVRDRLRTTCGVPNAEKTVSVRIISDCNRSFKVPDVVRKHFRMATSIDRAGGNNGESSVSPPVMVRFKSKAIALFQKIDHLDVCLFCMYVQEYEGNDEYKCEHGEEKKEYRMAAVKRRVYIAYLDSIEYLRPRSARTLLYHELIVSYLATARLRGFESAHIWACPPSRGNSFVFWNHPKSQRTPTKERLIAWYHGALSRAMDCGVVTDVQSMYESDFQEHLKEKESTTGNEEGGSPLDPSGKMVCPPLLEGDYWIEEAVRIHASSLARCLKAKSPNEGKQLGAVCDSPVAGSDPCPARQVGAVLLDRVIAHTSAAPFRRPVNAAALKLKDYHKIVTNPMDLGTVYTRCVHGEYRYLGDLVEDVQLVFANAKKFNPKGHFVHTMALEVEEFFFKHLGLVTATWATSNGEGGSTRSWRSFAGISMSLDVRIQLEEHHSIKQDESIEQEGANAQEVIDTGATDQLQSSSSGEMCCNSPANISIDRKGGTVSIEELLSGGPDALSQRMAGVSVEKGSISLKKPTISKKGSGKRRRSSGSSTTPELEEPALKRRRQTWLGEEVGASVRSMRTSFFACSLLPSNFTSEIQQRKASVYSKYTEIFYGTRGTTATSKITSQLADSRSALLEFSQRHNLEFDTLRHAKYSTAVILYHLHKNPDLIPSCTSCNQPTTDCRWHKIVRVEELRKTPAKQKKAVKHPSPSSEDKLKFEREELCSDCHSKHPKKDQFIPLPISFPSD